jgi:hypothetical protein
MAFSLGGAVGGASSGAGAGGAFGPWGAVAGGAIGGLAGGFLGDDEQSNPMIEALKEMQGKAIAELEKVGVPTVEAQKILLESPQDVFKYVPDMEERVPGISTAFDNVAADPRLKQAQFDALDEINRRSQVGFTAEDIAELNAVRRGAEQQNKARMDTIVQQKQEQGMGGSGTELAMQIAAGQQTAQAQALADQELSKNAITNKYAALDKLLAGSTELRNQDIGEQAQVASSKDVMAKYNQQNQMDTNKANIAAANQAKLLDAQNKQALEAARTSTANTQETSNKALIQKEFENNLAKRTAMANVYTGGMNAATSAGAAAKQGSTDKAGDLANTLTGAAKLGQTGVNAYNEYKAKNPSTPAPKPEVTTTAYDSSTMRRA